MGHALRRGLRRGHAAHRRVRSCCRGSDTFRHRLHRAVRSGLQAGRARSRAGGVLHPADCRCTGSTALRRRRSGHATTPRSRYCQGAAEQSAFDRAASRTRRQCTRLRARNDCAVRAPGFVRRHRRCLPGAAASTAVFPPAHWSRPVIEVTHLAKSFIGRRGRAKTLVKAVNDVSFRAQDGRITALLGPNGAGKTTTLRVLATLMRADQGTAAVGGFDVTANPVAVRTELGVLSDARGLYTRLTARENINYYADLRRVPNGECASRLEMLAELLDMRDLLDRRTDGFSTGERMKVALARALIHDPRHLILDEPTNGLDVTSTRAMRRLLRHLRDQGKCLLFSTHIMQEVEQLCDEIVIVAQGRTVAHGTAAALCQAAGTDNLEDAFVQLALEARARESGAAQPVEGHA